MYYIYVLMCPINKQPFYVGKGKGSRAQQHLNAGITANKWNERKRKHIEGLRLLGYEPLPMILLETEDENYAFEVEHFLLNYGFVGLTNIRRCKDRPGGRSGKVEVDVDRVRQLYVSENKTKDQVCEILGIGKATINRVLDENGIVKLYSKVCKPSRIDPGHKYRNIHAYQHKLKMAK